MSNTQMKVTKNYLLINTMQIGFRKKVVPKLAHTFGLTFC